MCQHRRDAVVREVGVEGRCAGELGGEGTLLELGLHQAEESIVAEGVEGARTTNDTRSDPVEGQHDPAPGVLNRAEVREGEDAGSRVRRERGSRGASLGHVGTRGPGCGGSHRGKNDIDVAEGAWGVTLPLGEGEEVGPKGADSGGEEGGVEEGRYKPCATDGGRVEARRSGGVRGNGDPRRRGTCIGRDEGRGVGKESTHVGIGEGGYVEASDGMATEVAVGAVLGR